MVGGTRGIARWRAQCGHLADLFQRATEVVTGDDREAAQPMPRGKDQANPLPPLFDPKALVAIVAAAEIELLNSVVLDQRLYHCCGQQRARRERSTFLVVRQLHDS